MRVLAFDTSFAAIDIAVLDGDAIAAHVSEPVATGHGERLLPLIEATLAGAGIAFADLDRIAVTLGPGGFTGLRVGIAVARALALSTGKPLVGMTSLELLARTALARGLVTPDATIIATADARKDMLYAQRFATQQVRALDAPSLVSAAEVAGVAATLDAIVVSAGNHLLPDARILAIAAPGLTPLAEARPFYVRAADAKPQSGKSLPRA